MQRIFQKKRFFKDQIFALTYVVVHITVNPVNKPRLVTRNNILLEKFYENHKSPQSNGTTASLNSGITRESLGERTIERNITTITVPAHTD